VPAAFAPPDYFVAYLRHSFSLLHFSADFHVIISPQEFLRAGSDNVGTCLNWSICGSKRLARSFSYSLLSL
jgi:hypothetical protein